MSDDIILWVGLPGSGKTYHATKHCDIIVDDITDLNQLPEDDELGQSKLGITDVNFCDSNILNKAISILKTKYPRRTIIVRYFENDANKCRANVDYRDDGRNVEGTIRRFENIYNPPDYAIKIWMKQ